jgi:two-component system cell cycle sensor histidine kinase/response regulator CckA
VTDPARNAERARSALVEDLRRWRAVFLAAAVVAAALLVVAFTAGRLASERTNRSAAVLRAANAAQRSAWLVESAVRLYGLRRDPLAPARAATARSNLSARVAELHHLVAQDSAQAARVDQLAEHLERWDTGFVAPILATGAITAAIADTGTVAFEEVSRAFEQVASIESERRLSLLAIEQRVAWATFSVLFAALIMGGIAFIRTADGLLREAERSRDQQRRLEEQAAELEQQARTMEDQASALEEQAAELEHRVEERDETNRLLERTQTFLDSALDSSPLGIGFYDRELRFQRVNDALARVNGVPIDEHIGRSIEEVIPLLAPVIRPILERVLATGRSEADVFVEGETPAAPGVKRRWQVTYYPIRRAGQQVVGVGCMVHDVTEQSHLEEQLRQSQKMEAVGRLAGGVAHDFNNVLTIIQSYAEVLASELPAESKGREELDAIRSAADRASALARQLLAFSRRQVVIPRVIDVNDVVQGMVSILQRLLRQGIELELTLAPGPVLVRLDPGQVEQVLMNLAINAVDAMPSGGVLHVGTRVGIDTVALDGEAPVPAITLIVRDTGTGMPPEVRERMFEPFFTTKPAGQGTGLGLATTYAIVREAGGDIRVDSTLGAGSSFEVLLPARNASEREPVTRASPIRGVPVSKTNECVLVAEDEPAIRHAICRMLRGHGFRVLEASSGGEALRVAAEEPGRIDLLLTDIRMPGIGGKELVQKLLETRPATRVILMSGYTDDELLREELGDARHVFLQKPFTARAVVAAVRELLSAD